MYSILNRSKIITISLIALFCLACSPAPTEVSSLSYFDLSSFMKTEIKRLHAQNFALKKEISVNGAEESKTIAKPDFEKELASFLEGDINKKAWQGSFEKDSTAEIIQYTRLRKDVPVKKLSIHKWLDTIQKVEIIMERKNILYHTIDTLIYKSKTGYEIRKFQKVKLLAAKKYKIIGQFN